MKLFRILLIFLCTVTWLQMSLAKTDPEIKALEERVSKLEGYKIDIATQADARAETLKNQVQKDIKDGLNEIEDAKKTLDILSFVGIPVTLGAFLLGGIGVILYIRKQVTTRISTLIEKKREEIIRLVETEAFDNRLRNHKKLLVISGDEESNEGIKKFMEKLKFKKVIYRVAGTFNDIPDHDLVIFNTPNGELSQESIDEFMQKSADEDNCYVAYSTKRLEPNPRLNFSNSRFTLYHSILSTLKYSEITTLIEEN